MSSPAFLQSFLIQERGMFRKAAEAVLEDGLGYRPDPKSRCAKDLIEHLIGHNLDLVELLEDGVIHHRNQVSFPALEAGVKQLDDSLGQAIDRLGSATDEQWGTVCRFYVGELIIMEASCEQLAWRMFLDSVHHRGQLTTYLRPMGSKVPSLYGPSADTMMVAN